MHRIRFKGPRGSASKGPFCVINWAIEEISFKVELLVHPTLVLSVGKDYPVLGSYENGHGAPFVPAVYYDESGFPYTSVTGEIVLSVNAQR
ncbi:hypothetical protein QYF36_013223 [Acer negundo]|nr:hypothetical protein QYF36_013223 [Acer negundo]